MNHLEVLRAELERLFELDELITLSRDVLGFDPDMLGGQATLSSFASALLAHCGKMDAVPALAEVLRASGKDVGPGVVQITGVPAIADSILGAGDELGPYRIARKLGEGRLAASYLANGEKGEVRLKVLHEETTRDKRALQRYQAITRLAGQFTGPGLPQLHFAGELSGRAVSVHSYIEGQPLSARVARTGPMHINEARPLFSSIVEAVAAMHDHALIHGALSLDNIMTYRNQEGQQAVVLVDVGTDRLRAPQGHERSGLSASGANPRTVSPEQVRGNDAEKASDIYSLGAVFYELLSGKPVFEGDILDVAYGHLAKTPAAPSEVAPRGWISADIDEVVLRLLAKSPAVRPKIAELSSILENLGRPRGENEFTLEQIEGWEQRLLIDPGDSEVAMALESSVGRGASAVQVGQAFRLAASMIDDPIAIDEKKSLLMRAARLLEQNDTNLEKAEAVYEEILSLDPRDDVALAGLEEVRRRSGKFEELVEMLLARAESSTSLPARASAMAEIGRIYFQELEDNEQAVVAYCQAYCDDPREEYAAEVERAAGTSEPLWAEALATLGEASQNQAQPQEIRTQLLLKAGLWYLHRISRADLALPCFQAVLSLEPANEIALQKSCVIYRTAQQWQELGRILTQRADAAATPAQARDLRAESAEILEQRLGDTGSARAIYEMVLSEDPGHERAADALARILEKQGDFDVLVKRLEERVEAQATAGAVRSLCRIGEIYDDRLNNPDEATNMYRRALAREPQSLDALRGLERVFAKLGKFQDLNENLEEQVALAATPKQRILLLERIASVHEEEFLNHKAAAQALERALECDPGRVSAMAALVRQLRVLERWEEASKLYERQLELVEEPKERVSLAMIWGRLLADQIGSPERALHAYELVLAEEPEHPGALEALARLREATGDAEQALSAMLLLADQAETPTARAEQYMRAAALQQSHGDADGAIEQYKNALDAQPENRQIAAALRGAYVKRGDINAAVELLEREIEITEGDRAQAKLAGEMARLQREGLKDDARAEASAKRSLHLDPGNLDALMVLGDVCFENARYVEASAHYGRLADRVETLGEAQAVPVLIRYVDALNRAGSTANALTAMDVLLRLAPDNAEAVGRVATVTFEHGAPKRAAELLYEYLTRFGATLSDRDRAVSTYHLGESYRKSGDPKAAIAALESAAELDPGAADPLIALAAVYSDLGDFASAVRAKNQHLDVATGDVRLELLIEIGDLCATHLKDRAQATRSYVTALEENPDDRRILTKLMQLYSEEKDWNKLVEVVVKLADFVSDEKQKVKYLQTAALVSARQIGDPRQAADFFEQVLELEPRNEKAMTELITIQQATGNYNAVEDLLKRRIALAEETEDSGARIAAYDALGELYERHIIAPDLAAQAYEQATEADPSNRERLDKLARIYEGDPEVFRDKGIALQEQLLSQNPFRQEGYKALRKIYTVARDADASWALCQVLSILKLAEPDEVRFYERMRGETAAPAQDSLNEEDWMKRLMHPQLDPLLTAVFGLIQPAVVAARAQPPEQLGLSPHMLIEPSQHEAPLAQTLYYAAGVLGVPLPNIYANPNDPGGLSYLYTQTPSFSLGRVGMSSQIPPQVAAFVAAQQLSYLRPGLYMRQFVQTGTALKAWLFAAIKITAPQFPIAAELEGSVNEALHALQRFLAADARDHLASVVSKLIQSGTSLDLKRWAAAVDLTADRVGFLVAHDLQSTTDVIRAADENLSNVGNEERFKQLILFASSSRYFDMRSRLGIRVDS